MHDLNFTPVWPLSELEKDENITIERMDDKICFEVKWDDSTYGMGLDKATDCLSYAWAHNLGAAFYLYDKYGIVFGDDAFEYMWYISKDGDEIDCTGAIFKHLCLQEMKSWLIRCGGDDGIMKKIDADLERIKPDYEKEIKEKNIDIEY